jgi:hypothetical protein
MIAKQYSMIIQWSEEDAANIVTLPESGGCLTHGETYEKTLRRTVRKCWSRWWNHTQKKSEGLRNQPRWEAWWFDELLITGEA